MAATDKDTIYIDVDDEITGIIDKLRASDGKIVALVLPKRASVFQSIVNMKLLKRAADDATKHLVLITSETGLLPLAGAAEVHVAKSLTSKPEIPAPPIAPPDTDEAIEEVADDPSDEVTVDNAGDKSVGELAGLSAAAAAADDMETVELDNADEPAAAAAPVAATKTPKAKKDKKLAVPNFERFRKVLIFGALLLIALIIAFIVANSVLPKATINISTDATSVNTDLNLNLSTTAKTLDLSDGTIPAKLAKEQKTYSQQAPATGQQNNGNKANGQVTLTNCSSDNADITVPAGTGLSAGGKTYITQSAAEMPFSGRHGNGNSCQSADGITAASVNVIAQSAGAAANTSQGTSFTVSGFSSVNAKSSGAISGGTDNIVTVVSQADIDNAKGKINTSDSAIKQVLQNDLSQDNYYAIAATFTGGTPQATSSAQPGDAASSVTVTENVNYTMFGVQKADLKTLVDNAVKDQIDPAKQSILSEGIDQAVFNVSNMNNTSAQLAMHTSATAGPQLNTSSIKQAAAGKKSGEVVSTLQQDPGVTGVTVKLSPFWVTAVPKKPAKITVVIAKPKPAASNSSAAQ